jgi:hypothetical protein
MTGDFSIDVPTYDAVFASMAKQWPVLPEELTVCKYQYSNFNSASPSRPAQYEMDGWMDG